MKNVLTIAIMLFLGIEANAAYNVWNQKANFGGIARHRTTSFAIGNKGYTGLGHYNSGSMGNTYQKDFWEYDPASDSWTQKADFGGGWRYHATGFSHGTKGYVGTGQGSATQNFGSAYFTNDLWEFDPIANVWIQKANMPSITRRGAVSFVIGDFAFIGTGQTGSGVYSTDFWAYDIINDQWLSGVPNLPGTARTSSVAFSINNSGYVGTGNSGGGTNDFYEYKMSTNTWTQRANVGPIPRQEAVGFAVNGKGYIGTGDDFSSGTNFKDMWEYDPATNSWIEIEEFAGTARRYLDAFVIGNKAYCGMGTSGVNFRDLWEFDQVLSTIDRDQDLVKISTYPNPVIDHVTFELNNLPTGVTNEDINIRVYDLQGKIALNEYFDQSSIEMDRGDLISGLYIYSISYQDTEIKQGKLIFE